MMKPRTSSLWAALVAAIMVSSLTFAQSHLAGRGSAHDAASNRPVDLQSKEFKRIVDLEAGGSLSINSDKGSVRLTAWDGNQVEIVARIDAPENVDADYGRRAVEGARIDVSGDSRAVSIRSNFDGVPNHDGARALFGNRSKTLPDIHYEIRAPRSLNVTVDLDRSRLDVDGFKGQVRLNTDRTGIYANGLEGAIRIRIDRGEAQLSQLRGSLDIEADRTNGKIQAVHIEGDSRLEVDRGNFELRMPESQALTINADLSRREDFDSDFGLTVQSLKRNSFQGTINGGGPKFSIHADRGSVSLKRQ